MGKPKYSIIIPTLNEEKFLPRLLDSLTEQTYSHFEVIVVDGNSTDKTVPIARSYQAKFADISCVISPRRGVSAQRNFGASLAKGEWLMFIDADSILLPYAMERIGIFIQTKHPQVFTTWFSPDSEVIGEVIVTLGINLMYESGILLRKPFTQGTFAAIEKSLFVSTGGFDEQIEFGEDYDLIKRLHQKDIPFTILRETLYIYSLRRFRHQRTLTTMQQFSKAVLSVLFLNRTPRSIAGYIMGGAPYTRSKRTRKLSIKKQFSRKFREIISDLFEQ